MRKHVFERLITLLCAVFIPLSSCAPVSPTSEEETVTIYYRAAADKQGNPQLSVQPETHAFKGSDKIGLAVELLFSDPDSARLKKPFPDGVSLGSFEIKDKTAFLDLSAQYAEMDGAALTLADSCVVLTLTGFDEISAVCITQQGMPHPLRKDGFLYFQDDFLLSPQGLNPLDVEFVLYFSDGEGRFLASEIQNANLREKDFALYMIELLISGPKTDGLLPVIPEGTRLLTQTMEGSTCFLSLSEEFVSQASGDPRDVRLTLAAIANSLTGLEGIDRVEILLDGAPLERYFMFDISDGLTRDETAFGSYQQGVAVEFIYKGADGSLVPVAADVPRLTDDLAYAILEEYCEKKPPLGVSGLLPDKTRVLDLRFDGFTAHLNLSAEFEPVKDDPLVRQGILKMMSSASAAALVLYVEGEQVNEAPIVADVALDGGG